MSTNWGPDDLERLHQADEEAEQARGGSGAILWLAIALVVGTLLGMAVLAEMLL